MNGPAEAIRGRAWRLLRRLFAWEPVQAGRAELVLLRVFFAVVLALNAHHYPSGLTAQPRPHGFAHWWDFTFIGDPGWFGPLLGSYFAAVLLFALGAGMVLPLGYVLFFQVSVSTLNLSQGSTGHAGQAVMLAVLGWWVAGVVQWVRRGCGLRALLLPDDAAWNRGVDWARQAVVAAYMVAGITKLVNSGGEWVARSGNFVLQWQKVVEEGRFSFGVEPEGWRREFGAVMLAHPWVSTVLLTGGLLLELGAFVALLNRRASLVFGVLVIAFHLMLGVLMGLPFIEYRRLVLVLFVNPAWPMALLWERWRQRVRTPR